jgi:hypothetical protein
MRESAMIPRRLASLPVLASCALALTACGSSGSSSSSGTATTAPSPVQVKADYDAMLKGVRPR